MSSAVAHDPGARRFAFPVTVYYEDTDAAGVVYYANYLKFMERARTEWLGSLGLPLAEFERRHAALFVVRRVRIDFHRPARLNDRLDATVEVVDRGGSRLVLAQHVRRGDDLIADAEVTLACVHAGTLKPRRMPDVLGAALEKP